jgi:hypothetical protein
MLVSLDGARSDADGPLLTRAEAHTLRRSARLTHLQLTEHLRGIPSSPRCVP